MTLLKNIYKKTGAQEFACSLDACANIPIEVQILIKAKSLEWFPENAESLSTAEIRNPVPNPAADGPRVSTLLRRFEFEPSEQFKHLFDKKRNVL